MGRDLRKQTGQYPAQCGDTLFNRYRPEPQEVRPRTAAAQALSQPTLLHAIVMQAPSRDHDNLQCVSRAWHTAVNHPQMWLQRFGPGVLESASCSLYVSFRPDGHVSEDGSVAPALPMSRFLGTFAGTPWRLRTGARPTLMAQAQHAHLVDRGTLLRLGFHGPVPQDGLHAFLVASRADTMDFLLDRAFRNRQGLLSPTYRPDSEDTFFALCVSPCLVCFVVFAAVKALDARSVPTTLAAAVVCSVACGLLGRLLRQLCQDVAADGRAMLHNMRFGHIHARQLNRLAQDLSALPALQAPPMGRPK